MQQNGLTVEVDLGVGSDARHRSLWTGNDSVEPPRLMVSMVIGDGFIGSGRMKRVEVPMDDISETTSVRDSGVDMLFR